MVKFEEMTDDDNDEDDESDKHLEARDRRYSCLIFSDARVAKSAFLTI